MEPISAEVRDLLDRREKLSLERDILALQYEIKQLETIIEHGDFSAEEPDGESV